MTSTGLRRAASPASLPEHLRVAARAAHAKLALDVVLLDLRHQSSFADYFLLCSGQNPRQVRAMAEAIEEALNAVGITPDHVEGHERSEWLLLDYFDFIVHVFSVEMRRFYGLERIWGSAERIEIPDSPD
jgi:ribosome-associated protein